MKLTHSFSDLQCNLNKCVVPIQRQILIQKCFTRFYNTSGSVMMFSDVVRGYKKMEAFIMSFEELQNSLYIYETEWVMFLL